MENNNSCHELYRIIKGKDPTVRNFQCPFSSPAKYCYTLKTSLIFLDTFKNFISKENKDKYKIVLITESPYNFPGCPIHSNLERNCECKYWAHDVDEFIRKHLAKFGFGKFGVYFPDEKETQNHIPWNIFSFIFYIFYPIFKHISQRFYGCSENDIRILWAYSFVNKVYWTHVAKRSLKGLNKNNAVDQCIPLLKEELEVIKPNLIIVATSHFWRVQGTSFGEIEEKQQCNNGEFLSLNKVIEIINKKINKKIDLLSPLFQQTQQIKIVVFPNPTPSPDNYWRKVDFYKKKYVPKLIKKIHEEIENNYDNLPDC